MDLLAAESIVLLCSFIPFLKLSELLLKVKLRNINVRDLSSSQVRKTIVNPTFGLILHMLIRMMCEAWTKLTKVDSCRLLFFLCFLCFFPSPSPSSFFPCPFCGTACDQHWVNILKVSRGTRQTTNQSGPAPVQVS